jgi:hypothetical protein
MGRRLRPRDVADVTRQIESGSARFLGRSNEPDRLCYEVELFGVETKVIWDPVQRVLVTVLTRRPTDAAYWDRGQRRRPGRKGSPQRHRDTEAGV